MKSQKVLVVGGAGYLGGHVVNYLLSQRIDVLVYDALIFERDYRKNVHFINGDVLDEELLSSTLEVYDPDSIIWLAARVGDGACAINPEYTMRINEGAVEWITRHFNKRIVFTSTCSVYGASDKILSENSPKNPLSIYAASKLQAEEHLFNNDNVIFRLGTLYGMSDEFSRIRMDLVVNVLSLKAILGEPLRIFGGNQWRPLLHVNDAAIAVAQAAIETDTKPILNSGIYNIARENLTIRQIAERIRNISISDFDVVINYSDIEFQDQRNYRVSSDRYKNSNAPVNFSRSVEDGALEIMSIIKQKRVKRPHSTNYNNHKFFEEVEQGGQAASL